MDRNMLKNGSLACVLFAVAGFAAPVIAQESKPATAATPAAAPAQPAAEPKKDEAKKESKKLVVGDDAPKIDVEKFLKGDEIKEYKKGHVYVVEFWATWCGPCKVSIPHLTELQKQYKDKVTIVGVDVWERNYSAETLAKVQGFIKDMGDEMNYTVAYDGESKKMADGFMKASGSNGIPTAFIVDQNGKVAYIGHPMNMEKTLKKVVEGTFDLKKEAETANKAKDLMQKIEKAITEGKPDDAMKYIDEFVATGAEQAGMAAMYKFNYLTEEKNDYAAAAKYAVSLADGIFKDDAQMLNQLSWTMVDPDGDFKKEFYDDAMKIAARAVEVTKEKDGAIIDTLARCYWGKGDKAKAIELQKKAVAAAKSGMKEQLEETLKEYEAEAAGAKANNPDGTE